MKKLCLIICFFITALTTSVYLYAAADPVGEADLGPGRARVRIWREALPERVGHVSLATQNSYISLWPSGENLIRHEGYAFSATALNVESYARDHEKEEGVDPDDVFEVGLDAAKIDAMWRVIRTNLGATTGDAGTLLPGVTWLAISHPSNVEGLHFNCASAVLGALEVGGLNTYDFVQSKVRALEMVESLREVVTGLEERTFKELGAVGVLYGAYTSVIKPGDIKNLLSTHIEEGYKRYFHDALRSRTLLIPEISKDFERDIVVKRLLAARARNDDKYHEYVLTGFEAIGCIVDAAGTQFSIRLSDAIQAEIEDASAMRTALALGGGVAAVGVGAVVAHKVTDGKCSIM